jgi:hypothetical protein
MKYLKRRNEFLVENKISLPKPINKNEIYLPINESGPMVNDIAWGDSLVGRLINSFIRTAKIKYNATKVDNLVKDFKSQLDIVLAESLSRDTRNEFILLMIKSMLNDIERTCSSTKTEEEKIEELLGTSDGNSLWDPKNPNRGSFTENVNDGILLKTHEKIKLDLDKDQIEVAGIPKDDFLGAIGDFIDDLREYAWSLSNNGSLSSQSTTKKTFSIRFKKLLNRIRKPKPQNASYNFIVKNYFDFINESSEDNKIELLKNIINNLLEMYNIYIKKGKQTSESFSNKNTEDLLLSLFTKIDSEKEKFKTIEYDKLLNDIINIHNGKSTESELANLIYFIYKNGDVNEIDKNNKLENINDIKNLFNLFKENMGKLIGSFKKETDKGDESKDIIDKLISIDDENEIENIVNKIPNDKKREILNNIVNNQESSDEDKKEAKELLEMIPESYSIKESISSNNTNVLNIWEGWIKDKGIPENMLIVSQQEIDKLEDMINGETSGQNLTFNPKKTPDPIINIVRIFKRAHDLYYTDLIPSGRTVGKVSNKTFREYEKLGTGQTSQSDASSPGYGPWAVKSIRNKWVDGVTKILEDQEYRKIFANTKFIVAGSEDTFNDSVNYNKYNKILESETEDKGKTKSQGQILFDFITDMLKKETAADFDKQKDILLKKYFGSSVEVKESELKQVNNVTKPDKPQDPIDDKTIYWGSIITKRIDIKRLNSDDEGPIIMFPYNNLTKGSTDTEILKFQVVEEIEKDDKDGKKAIAYIIKTFDKVDNTDFYKKDYNTFKVSNDDELGNWKNDMSYAIIFTGSISGDNIKGSKKFKIIFYNSNGKVVTSLVEIKVADKSLNGNFVPSVLYKKDSGKSEQINTKDNIDSTIEKELAEAFDKEIKK